MEIHDFVQNGFESGLRTLFRRCLKCPSQRLDCPQCSEGKICVQRAANCHECSSMRCETPDNSGLSVTPQSTSGGPNIGAIVGGVVGGLIFIAILTWLAWRFFILPRRQKWGVEIDETYEPYSEKDSSEAYPSPQEKRQSQVTRRSMASTTYTRGSNVIQIAFIPGITDRSGEDEALVPPVPPIPIRTASSTPQSPQSPYADSAEDHYFMPGDLRDSAYSGFDDDASTFNRQSLAPSIAPSLLRHSIASTVNGPAGRVESLAPAQTAQRGRPMVVSVKSSAANSRSPSVPAVPQVDFEKYGSQKNNSPSVYTPSVHSFKTASDNMVPALDRQKTQTSSIPSIKLDTGSNLSRQQTPPQLVKATASEDEKLRSDLQSAIEEATRQASEQPVHGGLGSIRKDPFSDENRLPDP